MQAQQHDNLLAFQELMLAALQKSFVEVLQVVVTAADSRDKGEDFYRGILDFLGEQTI